MPESILEKGKYWKVGFFVLGIPLVFLTFALALQGLPNNTGQLEAKYVQAVDTCQLKDEHVRFACYKDVIKSFLSKHPEAKGDFYKIFLPHIIKKTDLVGNSNLYMTPLSSNCHVFMHAVGEVAAETYFASNPENPEALLEILSTECRLGDRVGAIMRLAKLKDFDSDYIDKLHQSCLLGIKDAGEADMQQCAHGLGHIYFDKYVFDTSPLHDGDFSIELGEIRSKDIERAFFECSKLSPLEKSGCFNAVAHSFYHLGHFFYHDEIEIYNDFSFLFDGCRGLKEFGEECYKALIYRIGLNEAGPYFLAENYDDGNAICKKISKDLGEGFGVFCYRGIGTFIGQIIHEYGEMGLESRCENIDRPYKEECYTSLERWVEYLKTRKINQPPTKSSTIVGGVSDSGVLVPGRFIGPGELSKPALVYIDPDNNFSFKNIDLEKFNFGFTGIHEARPITVNGEYKIALGAHNTGDEKAYTPFVILNNGTFGFDNLEIDFKEQVEDARIRAVFVGDIDNDGEEEIIIGTRPKGILKYYKSINNQWVGFDIDFLNETIHDILIADINRNGRNEIIATVSSLSDGINSPTGDVTGRIISYEFVPEENTWGKKIIWIYNKTFTSSLIGDRGFFEHPRYIFASDIDGDDLKEIIVNVLGSQNIEVFKWNGSSYSREIIENKLTMHDSAITVGDIDNDGRDEVIALTLPEHILVMYDYNNESWEREILLDDLLAGEGRINYLYILESARDSYGKILYAIESPDNIVDQHPGGKLPFYYLERDNDVWGRKYIGTINSPMVLWGIFPVRAFSRDSMDFFSGGNAFSSCETINDSTKRYDCYKNAALSSLQNGRSVEGLSQYAFEFPHNRHHLMGHAIARAALIVSGYNFDSTMEKCLPNCIAGYWHGIAEEWGKYAPLRAKEYIDFFAKLCDDKQSEGVDCTGHSVGHLYMSVNKNLEENFVLCDKLESDIMFPECIMGTMHQYRIDGGAKDVFGICESHVGRIKKACYETSSFLYSRWASIASIEQRFENCRELGGRIPLEFNRCYDGIRDLLSSKGATPPLERCENLSNDFKELCIKELTSPAPFRSGSGCGGEPTIVCGGL